MPPHPTPTSRASRNVASDSHIPRVSERRRNRNQNQQARQTAVPGLNLRPPSSRPPSPFTPPPTSSTPPPPPVSNTLRHQNPIHHATRQQLLLLTKEGAPAGYTTKWEDLDPFAHKVLLVFENRIREYKDESQRLDQCSRLYDSSVRIDSFGLVANKIYQDLKAITNAIEREKVSAHAQMDTINRIMWNTQFSIRSYIMLRPRFLRLNAQSDTGFDFYSGVPQRPSVFMEHTVAKFEAYLLKCCQWIQEVEQLVKMKRERSTPRTLELLPKVILNMHDYFIYVASKVESLHQNVESMKQAYLADQRRRGDSNDPFLEADRWEAAKKEAASRRVHPTLQHSPAVYPDASSAQVAGVLANSAAPIMGMIQPTLGASSSRSDSLFITPSSAPSSPLFTTPVFPPQSTPLETLATSLFGDTQSPTGFGTSTPPGSTSSFNSPSDMSISLSDDPARKVYTKGRFRVRSFRQKDRTIPQ